VSLEEEVEELLKEGIKRMMARDRDGLQSVNDRLRERLSSLKGDELSLVSEIMGGKAAKDLNLVDPVTEYEVHLSRVERSDELDAYTDFARERFEELKEIMMTR